MEDTSFPEENVKKVLFYFNKPPKATQSDTEIQETIKSWIRLNFKEYTPPEGIVLQSLYNDHLELYRSQYATSSEDTVLQSLLKDKFGGLLERTFRFLSSDRLMLQIEAWYDGASREESGWINDLIMQINSSGNAGNPANNLIYQSNLMKSSDTSLVYRLLIFTPHLIETYADLIRPLLNFPLWVKIFNGMSHYREEVANIATAKQYLAEHIPAHYADESTQSIISINFGNSLHSLMQMSAIHDRKSLKSEDMNADSLCRAIIDVLKAEGNMNVATYPYRYDLARLIGDFQAIPPAGYLPKVLPEPLEQTTHDALKGLCANFSPDEYRTIDQSIKLAVRILFKNSKSTLLPDSWPDNFYTSYTLEKSKRNDFGNWKIGPHQYDVATFLLGNPELHHHLDSEMDRIDNFLEDLLLAYQETSMRIRGSGEVFLKTYDKWKLGLMAALFLRGMRISSLEKLSNPIRFTAKYSSDNYLEPSIRQSAFLAGLRSLELCAHQGRNIRQVSGIESRLMEKSADILLRRQTAFSNLAEFY